MKCIKCSKDTTGSAVFCEECLVDMQRHPVKPGTPVILPKREAVAVTKHSRKRTLKPEQQVHFLKKAVGLLAILVILLIAALAASIFMLLDQADKQSPALAEGQSFSTQHTANSTDEFCFT